MPIDIDRERSYQTPWQNSPLLPLLLISLAMQKHTPDTKCFFNPVYDYIVVGAGSGGSVVAARLSDAGKSVLLLEAGKSPPLLTDLPAAQPYFGGTDLYWNYLTEPQAFSALGHDDRRVPCASGKVVGGSSTDNQMYYIRGNHADYEFWEKDGAAGWNWTTVFPFFLKAEDNTDPDIAFNGYHSVGGPITFGRYGYKTDFHEQLRKTVLDMGYAYHDINGRRQIGFADLQGSLRRRQRCSTGKGYLVPRENNPNLDIITEAFVTKVIIEDKTATGVRFNHSGLIYEVRATSEVILCAGALRTPQILMLSGIGPRKTLRKFGIPVIANLPVGQNYHDPAGTIVHFATTRDRPTIEDKLKDEGNIVEYISHRTGPLAGVIGTFGLAFITDDPIANFNDLPDQWLFFLEGVYGDKTQFGLSDQVYEQVFGPYINKSVIQCAAQDPTPRSRGYVTIRSTDPNDCPAINPNYYQRREDLLRVVNGMKTCYRIMEHPFMKKLGYEPFATKMPGCEEIADFDAYLECYARTFAIATFHQVGTARMGDISDPRTVVDPELRVKGIRGLRIVDSSTMPQLPRGGSNNPVIMMAERISAMITTGYSR